MESEGASIAAYAANVEKMEEYQSTESEGEDEEEEGEDKEDEDEEQTPGLPQHKLTKRLDKSCGKIMKIELRDFMCHKNLHVSLGEKINFITGQNGTGKSVSCPRRGVCVLTKTSVGNRSCTASWSGDERS